MSDIVRRQRTFYEKRLEKFGDDPRTLAYNSVASQQLRFRVLKELFRHEQDGSFSVHEVGCGLAHFGEYLVAGAIDCEYSGSEISAEFVELSRRKFPDSAFVHQDVSRPLDELPVEMKGKDYYVLSGTFNTIDGADAGRWQEFVSRILRNMYSLCRKGIAFNMLTSYAEYTDPKLYYADPTQIYDWSLRNLSRFVTLISDYALYEFSVLVYKEDYVRSLHPAEFDRYFSRKTDNG